jgi:hypothetical protein
MNSPFRLLASDSLIRYGSVPNYLIIPGYQYTTLTIGCHIMQLRAIDTINQSFECRFMLILTWKTTKKYEDINITDLNKEWKPTLLFTNSRSKIVKLQEDLYKLKKHRYTYMIYKTIYDGVFIEHFKLHHFPMDTQRLFIRMMLLDFPTSTRSLSSRLDNTNFKILKTNTIMYSEGFSESNTWKLVEEIRLDEGKSLPERHDGMRYNTVNIYMTISRNVGFYIWNAIIPAMILVTCSFISFVVDISEFAASCLISLTMMLTLIALKFSLMQFIQTTSYMTYLDIYILIAYCYISLVILQNVIIYLLSKQYESDEHSLTIILKANTISGEIMCGTWFFFNLLVISIMSINNLRKIISYPLYDSSFTELDIDNISLDNLSDNIIDLKNTTSDYIIDLPNNIDL